MSCSSRIPSLHHIALRCRILLGSSWPWQFLRISLFLMTWAVLRRTGQAFCRMSLNRGLSYVFLMIRLGLRFLCEEDLGANHIGPRVNTIDMTYRCRCWAWSSGRSGVCQVLPLWSYSILFSFPTLYFLEGNHNVELTLEKLELHSTSLRVAYVQKLFGLSLHRRFVSFLSHCLFKSFTFICMDS